MDFDIELEITFLWRLEIVLDKAAPAMLLAIGLVI